MWDTFCIQKICMYFVCKSLSKCGLHLVNKHFVYIWYKFDIQNVCKSLLKCWIHFVIQTFCIPFVYINSNLQKVCIINIMCTICMQNSYRMHIK